MKVNAPIHDRHDYCSATAIANWRYLPSGVSCAGIMYKFLLHSICQMILSALRFFRVFSREETKKYTMAIYAMPNLMM